MAIDPLAPVKFGLRLGIGVLRFELHLVERVLGLAEPEPEAVVVVVEDEREVAPFEPVAFPEPVVHEPEPVPEPAPEAPAHIDTEPELVAEFADPGAEEGAGAELHVAEPWHGYRSMAAADIRDRVAIADAAQLAVVQLYEASHRKRRTVFDAVARRERELTNAPAR